MKKSIPAVGTRIRFRLAKFQEYSTGVVIVSRPDCFDVRVDYHKYGTVLDAKSDFQVI